MSLGKVHGQPVALAGRRLAIVEQDDAWAIMNATDPFPHAMFRYPKDQAGWDAAVRQLQASDDAPPPQAGRLNATRQAAAAQPVPVVPRIVGAVVSIALGVTTVFPWMVLHGLGAGSPSGTLPSGIAADQNMFDVFKIGPRDVFGIQHSNLLEFVPWLLVALAALGLLFSLAGKVTRLGYRVFVVGVLALGPTVWGAVRVYQEAHDHSEVALLTPTRGWGMYAAFGCIVAMWFVWVSVPSTWRGRRSTTPAPIVGPSTTVVVGGPASAMPILGTPGGFSPVGADGIPSGPGTGSDSTASVPAALGPPASPAPQGQAGAGTPPPPAQPQPSAVVPPPASLGVNTPIAAVQQNAPAGWHPSPGEPGMLRYWDGNEWTSHTHPA